MELSSTRKVNDRQSFFCYNYINNSNFQGNNFKNDDLSVDYEDDYNEKNVKMLVKLLKKN